MPTHTYFVKCEKLVDNPNQGNTPFAFIAHFKWEERPEVKLEVACLKNQYKPGETYSLSVGS